MKLATAAAVQGKLGVSTQFADNTEMYEAGLTYATAQLENILDTALDAADVLDVWDYQPSKYQIQSPYKPLQLIAARGFWQEPPLVYMTTDGTQITPDVLPTLTPLSSLYFTYNMEQGTVRLNLRPFPGLATVGVSYSSGFQDGGSDAPEWLQQAAVGYAIQNIQLHNIGYNKKEYRDKSTEQARLAYSVTSRHIRTRNGEYPASSTVL